MPHLIHGHLARANALRPVIAIGVGDRLPLGIGDRLSTRSLDAPAVLSAHDRPGGRKAAGHGENEVGTCRRSALSRGLADYESSTQRASANVGSADDYGMEAPSRDRRGRGAPHSNHQGMATIEMRLRRSGPSCGLWMTDPNKRGFQQLTSAINGGGWTLQVGQRTQVNQ
jgi:hypothetical protein